MIGVRCQGSGGTLGKWVVTRTAENEPLGLIEFHFSSIPDPFRFETRGASPPLPAPSTIHVMKNSFNRLYVTGFMINHLLP